VFQRCRVIAHVHGRRPKSFASAARSLTCTSVENQLWYTAENLNLLSLSQHSFPFPERMCEGSFYRLYSPVISPSISPSRQPAGRLNLVAFSFAGSRLQTTRMRTHPHRGLGYRRVSSRPLARPTDRRRLIFIRRRGANRRPNPDKIKLIAGVPRDGGRHPKRKRWQLAVNRSVA